jgi:hypothetical protein
MTGWGGGKSPSIPLYVKGEDMGVGRMISVSILEVCLKDF